MELSWIRQLVAGRLPRSVAHCRLILARRLECRHHRRIVFAQQPPIARNPLTHAGIFIANLSQKRGNHGVFDKERQASQDTIPPRDLDGYA